MAEKETLGALELNYQEANRASVLEPLIDPITDDVLDQRIAIPYTTTLPSFTPRVNGVRRVYYDGSDYWLYIYANGSWRSQKLGITGATVRAGRLHLGSAQNIPNTTVTQVQVNTATFTATNVTADTGNYKFTVTATGIYLITGHVYFATTPADGKFFDAIIYAGTSGGSQRAITRVHSGSAAAVGAEVNTILSLTSGDDVFLYANHNNGGDVGLQTNTDGTYLSIYGVS